MNRSIRTREAGCRSGRPPGPTGPPLCLLGPTPFCRGSTPPPAVAVLRPIHGPYVMVLPPRPRLHTRHTRRRPGSTVPRVGGGRSGRSPGPGLSPVFPGPAATQDPTDRCGGGTVGVHGVTHPGRGPGIGSEGLGWGAPTGRSSSCPTAYSSTRPSSATSWTSCTSCCRGRYRTTGDRNTGWTRGSAILQGWRQRLVGAEGFLWEGGTPERRYYPSDVHREASESVSCS